MSRLSLDKKNIKILLLEGIHQNAVDTFKARGFSNVTRLTTALEGAALREAISDTHIIGLRSRTKLTQDVLEAGKKLFAVGCFCIGTNQVDLIQAKSQGVPVFNAPYSNTRSVAELVIGEMIMLMRRIPARMMAAHRGDWNKSASGSYEVRGKTLGIIGYGHIGSQLSVLAESMGLKVIFYDIADTLVHGNATPCATMDELLSTADVVSLHVPATPETEMMITGREIGLMKKGSYLINASRGNVVDIDALAAALRAEAIDGAAVDVFPKEPKRPDEKFESPLRGLDNVILTPHIGGSTQEAQENIGIEVAEKLVRYTDNGTTAGSVNFVEVSLPVQADRTRFLHIHRNLPGVLSKVNGVFSNHGLNIAGQYLRTDSDMGYVVIDIDGHVEDSTAVRDELAQIDGTLRSRFLY
ncbi:MAG: D-3-phosphoglycerate dehydrogenase [Myxococcota bacterium]|jgi:D-3-phosphoglycerate dehydrogenase